MGGWKGMPMDLGEVEVEVEDVEVEVEQNGGSTSGSEEGGGLNRKRSCLRSCLSPWCAVSVSEGPETPTESCSLV